MTDEPSRTARSREQELEELAQIEQRAAELRASLQASTTAPRTWWPETYYAAYHVVIGAVLGLFAAGASLLFNVVGSLMVGQHPLQIVRVYLTFPLGARALTSEDGVALSTGVLLYLGTGTLFGAVLHGIGQRRFPDAPLVRRLLLATLAGVALWLVNFYGILSWLQPLAFDGDWIVREVPPAVGAATHVVFTWTLTLLAFLGRFEPPVTTDAASGPTALAAGG